jgi:hypothetical protein
MYVGACTFWATDYYVNGQYDSTETTFIGCYGPSPGGLNGGGGGGGGASGTGTQGSNTTVCAGPAKFTGVSENQAPASGAFSGPPLYLLGHTPGDVAVKPSLYGLTMPGTATGNAAVQAVMTPLIPLTTIIPQSSDAPRFGGPAPPYQVSDIISPPSVRNSPGQQFDVYDFPTEGLADKATMSNANTFVVVNSPTYSCPAGFVKY